jgi:hypothetical protein
MGVIDEPDPYADGVRVLTLLEAERGQWVVYTALREHAGYWRVDLGASLAQTAALFLQQRGFRPMYTEANDARGRAMRFWRAVTSNDASTALELTVEKAAELPEKMAGFALAQMEELYWCVGYTVRDADAVVRVLVNRYAGTQTWETTLIMRDGEWWVDLEATHA